MIPKEINATEENESIIAQPDDDAYQEATAEDNAFTIHSEPDNTTLTIPFSDRPLNSYAHQIVISQSNLDRLSVTPISIFTHKRLEVTFTSRNVEDQIF